MRLSIHTSTFLDEFKQICEKLDFSKIEQMAKSLAGIRDRHGRLFIIGVGGSAANASHAVNDFRKLCRIEAYAPTDNVAELTAIANDIGWNDIFSHWLDESNFSRNDGLLVLSVGGGHKKASHIVSECLVRAMILAKEKKATTLSIVGKPDGYAALHSDVAVITPEINSLRITPHAEATQSVLLHLLTSHPVLQRHATKW